MESILKKDSRNVEYLCHSKNQRRFDFKFTNKAKHDETRLDSAKKLMWLNE